MTSPRRGSEAREQGQRRARHHDARRRARIAIACGLSIALIGFLFAFYFPTRTWLHQRSQRHAGTSQLASLRRANAQLEAKVHALNQPSTIEDLARSQYGMVPPGAQAYVVLPPSVGATTLPTTWPFTLRPPG
jgi:cell division protein FtsB